MAVDLIKRLLWLFLASTFFCVPGSVAQNETEAEVQVETMEVMEGEPDEEAISEGGASEDTSSPAVTEKEGEPDLERETWDLPVRLDDTVRIRKIYEFLNDPKVTKTGKDRSLEYEFKYFNHGAITKAQRYNREGQYYIVTWTNSGGPADYVLRLDYRQGQTREQVKTITIPYPNAEGTFKGTFSVTGDDYYMDGNVLSWRISVVRNGQIVAQKKSFVW